jgi:hypothetical protein
MAGVIVTRDLTFNAFPEVYSKETEQKEITGTSEGQSAPLRRYIQTLSTIWALDNLDTGSKTLLEVISFLFPDNIPESLLENNPTCTDWDRYPKICWNTQRLALSSFLGLLSTGTEVRRAYVSTD